jgi:hypothetical protein
LDQCWEAFQLHPVEQNWDVLKTVAEKDWASWRHRALAHVAQLEARRGATLSVRLLLHDRDLAAATALAQTRPIDQSAMQALAEALESVNPLTSAEFYLQLAQARLGAPMVSSKAYPGIVAILKRACRLMPAAQWQAHFVALRAQHVRKPKLMELLAQAGL